MCNHLRSDKHYVLMLRSFRSQLVVETVDRVRAEEREATRMVRGEPIPTGQKYTHYAHTNISADNVTDFLVSGTPDLHVVHINGVGASLTNAPLSLISSESHWWQVFTVLAGGAAVVAIVPETSASLVEEIKSVMTLLRHKTLFFMPPSVEDNAAGDGSWLSGATREKRWREIREQLALDLPEYAAEGMILLCPQADSLRLARHPYSQGTVAAFAGKNSAQCLSIGEAVCELERCDLLSPTVSELERLARQLM